jgi:UDPglucose 6-dehydrogenase
LKKAPAVGFVGMTHLGLVSGVCAAEKGFEVVCFDPDTERLGALRRRELPVSEPQLDTLIASNAERICFTYDVDDLRRCDLVYVAPDVATDDAGKSDLGAIDDLLERTFAAARTDAVVVVLSQVPPGYTRSKLRDGRQLYYQVETLIFGRAVERALFPERYIIGCFDPALPLPPAYAAFLGAHDCPLLPMRFESAELAKISINMCLVGMVSVANTMAELCERVGAAWAEIVPALKLDRRIGPHAYLAPGLGIAGGNLERDLATVCNLADHHGTDAGVVRAWISNSRHRRDWALRTLHEQVFSKVDDPVLAVLGLAYKQDTHSVKNSPSLALIEHLKAFRIQVYDPLVRPDKIVHPRCRYAHSAIDACHGADAVAVMTPWAEFAEIDPARIAASLKGRVVLDPYSSLNAAGCRAAGLHYITLGAT